MFTLFYYYYGYTEIIIVGKESANNKKLICFHSIVHESTFLRWSYFFLISIHVSFKEIIWFYFQYFNSQKERKRERERERKRESECSIWVLKVPTIIAVCIRICFGKAFLYTIIMANKCHHHRDYLRTMAFKLSVSY